MLVEAADMDAGPLHVLDLPQLYLRPSADALLDALNIVALEPISWDVNNAKLQPTLPRVHPEGLTKYLTSIVASSLRWIEDYDLKEKIWELASVRLSERSGRTVFFAKAQPAMSRTFDIPLTPSTTASITLHEPSLTADNLGLKTWASSYLLSRRLHLLQLPHSSSEDFRPRVLELGSGTGLVGIAAATVWGAQVHLTDLPEIVTNLAHNVDANLSVINENSGKATTGVLDWTQFSTDTPLSALSTPWSSPSFANLPSSSEFYPTILAADPLYSPAHPQLLVQTINALLSRTPGARVVVELPLREAYMPEIEEFGARMHDIGLLVLDEGEEVGFDDWGGGAEDGGGLREVRCWWGIWGWAANKQEAVNGDVGR
ncbi:MAG: hypothetical protein M1819_000646 [Sarea resinae]|nr:MAG: hypothetical protein M1819_000646 [Sarea resinae]